MRSSSAWALRENAFLNREPVLHDAEQPTQPITQFQLRAGGVGKGLGETHDRFEDADRFAVV